MGKVYKITPRDPSWNGCALVAANNEKEAKDIYTSENELNVLLFTCAKCNTELVNGLNTTSKNKNPIILDTIKAVLKQNLIVWRVG